jgi:acyl dehydratase
MENKLFEGYSCEHHFQITRDIHEGFSALFNDRNELHMSNEYAKSKGFAEKVMHGNILCGFLSCFVGELLPERNTIIHEMQIQYKKPCYIDDQLTLKATLLEWYDSVQTGLFNFEFFARNQLVAVGKIQIGLI